jgi:peptidoglycan/xylan/chitin deacetylase (PgdA/CDA1 family)
LTNPSGLHRYTHELVSTLNASQERDVLAKSIEILTSFTGKKLKGGTSPAWSTSKRSIKLLEEFGIVSLHPFSDPF